MSDEEELFEGELYVAAGTHHPVVLQVQRYGSPKVHLGLFELTSGQDPRRDLESGPMTLAQATERYSMIWPVWRYASIQREGPEPEVAVEDLTTAPITEHPAPIRAAVEKLTGMRRRRRWGVS